MPLINISTNLLVEMMELRKTILGCIQSLSEINMDHFYQLEGNRLKLLVKELQNIWYKTKEQSILSCIELSSVVKSCDFALECKSLILIGIKMSPFIRPEVNFYESYVERLVKSLIRFKKIIRENKELFDDIY